MSALHVLLIDDDAVDRKAVRRTLRAAGLDVTVTEAETGPEALVAVRRSVFDCILLDYRLPGTDGLTVLTDLRAAGIETPVVALTAQADQETAVAMMKAGAADYLHKASVTPDSLERSIRHALHVAAAERERRELLAREQAARLDAQAANRAKDEFLATLSHELRTPLNSILGWTRLLTSGSLDEAGTRRALETIERNVLLQGKLIDDLLDISRIVTGKLTIDRQPVSFTGVVAAAIESQRPAALAAGVTLAYDAPDEEQAVIGEAARLQQIVTNLLSNAIKFTPAGGRVDVALTFVDGQARLTVTDTGVGIAPDFLPYVFERFRQADASTTRKFGGLGLGLAIVRRLAELHGGRVSADSGGPGCGTTLTVELPVAASSVATSRPSQITYPNLGDTSVLIVDDDEDGRALVAVLLEHCGARVRTAASVDEAMRAIQSETPDVLLSDIAMPDEDGYRLMERVRAGGYDLRAAAISACVTPEDRARAVRAGFTLHVRKPVQASELFSAVMTLRGSPELS